MTQKRAFQRSSNKKPAWAKGLFQNKGTVQTAALGKQGVKTILRKSVGLAAAATFLFSSGLPAFTNYAAAQSAITTTGQTATKVEGNSGADAKIAITTKTVNGINALNDFNQFNVAGGDTVNLILPQSTSNLLNFIRGGQSSIDGNLYSRLNNTNGLIGGNVYLLNPSGVVVGAQGSINVGSLTVATPSHSSLDHLFQDALHNKNYDIDGVLLGLTTQKDGKALRAAQITNLGTIKAGNLKLYTNGNVNLQHEVLVNVAMPVGNAVKVDSQGNIEIVASSVQLGAAKTPTTIQAAGQLQVLAQQQVATGNWHLNHPAASITVDNALITTDKGINLTAQARGAAVEAQPASQNLADLSKSLLQKTFKGDIGDALDTAKDAAIAKIGSIDNYLNGLDATAAQTKATITVKNSTLTTQQDLSLQAKTSSAAQLPTNNNGFTVAGGSADSEISLDKAALSAGKNLQLLAASQNDLAEAAAAKAPDTTKIDLSNNHFSAALAGARTTANIAVKNGSSLTAAGKATVDATAVNTTKTSSNLAKALPAAKAWSLEKKLPTKVGAANAVINLSQATADVQLDKNSKVQGQAVALTAQAKNQTTSTAALTGNQQKTLAANLSINQRNNTANVAVAGKVSATNDLTIAAQTTNDGKNTAKTSGTAQAYLGLNGSYSGGNNTAKASIGDGAILQAGGNLAITAQNTVGAASKAAKNKLFAAAKAQGSALGNDLQKLQAQHLPKVLADGKNFVDTLQKLPEQLADNSNAQAAGSLEGAPVNAALNITNFNNVAVAAVGKNVAINKGLQQSRGNVAIAATNDVASLSNVAENGQADKTGIGGALQVTLQKNTAQATVGDGTSINAANASFISTNQVDTTNLAGAAVQAADVRSNSTINYNGIDNFTKTTLGKAIVKAKDLTAQANDDLTTINVVDSAGLAKKAGASLTVNVNNVKRDTAVEVGATIDAQTTNLQAQNKGSALSLSLASSAPKVNLAAAKDGLLNKIKNLFKKAPSVEKTAAPAAPVLQAKFAGAGNLNLNLADTRANVSLDNAAIKTGTLNIEANDQLRSATGAGAIAANGKVDTAATFVYNQAQRNVATSIKNSSLQASQAANIAATSSHSQLDLMGNGTFALPKANGVSVNAAAVVNQGATTVATKIDKNSTLTAQNAQITAADASKRFIANLSGAVNGTGVTATQSVNVAHNSTTTSVDGTIKATGDVQVRAAATTQLGSAGLGIGGGKTAGVALTGSVDSITNKTAALLNGSTVAGNLEVAAQHTLNTQSYQGTGAFGSAAGVAGTDGITASNNQTVAAINGQATAENSIKLAAQNTTNLKQGNIALAGGTVGVAGGAIGNSLNDVATAIANRDAVLTAKQGNISLTAQNQLQQLSVNGNAGLGKAVGVGAAASVNTTNSTVQAALYGNAAANNGTVAVNAQNAQDLSTTTVGVGAGLAAGITGAVNVRNSNAQTIAAIGDGQTAQTVQAKDVLVKADNSLTRQAHAIDIAGGKYAGIGANVDVLNNNTSTQASINKTTNVQASGTVSVQSLNDQKLGANIGGISGAGAAGVGASIGVYNFGGKLTNDAQDYVKTAQADLDSFQKETLGAANIDLHNDNVVQLAGNGTQAILAAKTVKAADVNVAAQDNFIAKLRAGQANIAGGAAVGAAGTIVNVANQAKAVVGAATSIKSNTLQVQAATQHLFDTLSGSGSAALGAAINGAGNKLVDSSDTVAAVNSNALQLNRLTVKADGQKNLQSKLYSGALGGLLAPTGALNYATLSGTTQATLGNGQKAAAVAQIAGATEIVAQNKNTAAVQSFTPAASGAFSGGLIKNVLKNDSSVQAGIGNNYQLAGKGNLTIAAQATPQMKAIADGKSFAGIAAVGAVNNALDDQTTVRAGVGDGAVLGSAAQPVGNIAITAQKTADGYNDYTDTTAGSGAILAGVAAADSQIKQNDFVQAGLGNNVQIHAGQLAILAQRKSSYNAAANTLNVSLAGRSGGTVKNDVQATALAQIGNDAKIVAQTVSVEANNTTSKDWLRTRDGLPTPNIKSKAVGAAIDNYQNVNHVTQATIGNGAVLDVLGKNQAGRGMTIEADSNIAVNTANALTGSALVSNSKAQNIIKANAATTATVGNMKDAKTQLTLAQGSFGMGTRNSGDFDAHTTVKNYSAVGIASGKSAVDYQTTTTTGNYGQIDALKGSVDLAAGRSAITGQASHADAYSYLDIDNNSFIPVSLTPDATANIQSKAQLTLAPDSSINAQEVNLTAQKGNNVARYFGSATNPYRRAIAAISRFFGGHASAAIFGGSATQQDSAKIDLPSSAKVNGKTLQVKQKDMNGTVALHDTAADQAKRQ